MNTENSNSANKVKPIPDGFHTITPFLIVSQAEMLMEFIKNAFNGHVTSLMRHDDGRIMHATMTIGDSNLMLSDASEHYGPMQAMLHLYVEDVDQVYRQALQARGESLREPTNEFYGDRSAGIRDPWGNQWWIATHVEDVSEEEIRKRAEEFRSQQVNS